MNTFKKQMDQNLTLKDINDNYPKGYIEQLRHDNASTNKLLGKRSNIVSLKRPLPEKGVDYTDVRNVAARMITLGVMGANGEEPTLPERMFNDDYGLKESYRFMPMSQKTITDRVFGETGMGYVIEKGRLIDFEPTEEMFRMDGVMLEKDEKLEPGALKANYKIEGVVTAFKSGDVLLTDVYNNDGTIDEDLTAKNDKAMEGELGGDNLKFTTVIALRNEDSNDVFYHEIDISKPDIANAVSNAIGEDDNIQPIVDQENKQLAILNQMEAITAEEELKMRGTLNTLDEKVFNSSIFEGEGQKYWGANSAGQENRYPLMKSFYMASDYLHNSYTRTKEYPQGDPNVYASQVTKAIDKDLFTISASTGGIEDMLKSYDQGNSEQLIIAKWLQNMNDGEKSYVKRRNTELAQKWAQMLSLVDN